MISLAIIISIAGLTYLIAVLAYERGFRNGRADEKKQMEYWKNDGLRLACLSREHAFVQTLRDRYVKKPTETDARLLEKTMTARYF